ncbi:PDZ domain-containing protein [bacterium]|nr:PDZ domain-containing protein [bacterium]MBU1652403.1 PDZ domain-containing protein [bacterium]MBU1882040.1 PDZ domain-containing protein [bacterium]
MTIIVRHLRRLSLIGGSLIVAALLFGLAGNAAAGSSDASGFLGVYLGDKVTIIVEKGEKSEDFEGVVIAGVVDDGPAEKAGMKKDDVILRFAGDDITSSDQLRKLIHKTKAGDKVDVVVHRDGGSEKLAVVMGERDDVQAFSWKDAGDHKINIRKFIGQASADRPWLGIEMQSLGDQLKDYFKIKGEGGILISEVVDDSPAKKAGLKAGDVILKIDDEEIIKQSDVIDVMDDHEIGDQITLNVLRDGKKKSMKATLAENPNKAEGFGYWFDDDDHSIMKLDGLEHIKSFKLYNDALELDEEELRELEEKLKDIEIDLDLDMDKLNEEMENMRKEIEILREEVKK